MVSKPRGHGKIASITTGITTNPGSDGPTKETDTLFRAEKVADTLVESL